MEEYNWTRWKPFPNPKRNDYVYAPYGPGVYQLRNKITGEYILFGESKNVAYRMTSLLPILLGQGRRRNEAKKKYILKNIQMMEYRTIACNKEDALRIQSELKRLNIHKFNENSLHRF